MVLREKIAEKICPIGTEPGSREWQFWCGVADRTLAALGVLGYELSPVKKIAYFVFDDETKQFVPWGPRNEEAGNQGRDPGGALAQRDRVGLRQVERLAGRSQGSRQEMRSGRLICERPG